MLCVLVRPSERIYGFYKTYKHTHTHTRAWGLTCDNAIVGRLQDGSIKLNDVLMTQDTKNLSLDKETRKRETEDLKNFNSILL